MNLIKSINGATGWFLLGVGAYQAALAHGSVTLEDDRCVIRISYLRAHFKVFQPRTGDVEEYCEELPEASESVFVMEYLHDALRETPIDFRIIRDVTGKGRFARWEDVQQIADLEAVTVFHQPAVIEPDAFTATHEFREQGNYIGVITAIPPGTTSMQIAVFPFEVGFTGFGYWPWIIGLVVTIQIHYLMMSGRLKRWWRQPGPRLTIGPGGQDVE